MIYTIFEHKPENFYPFSLNHAVFEIRSGAFSHLDRIQSSIGDKDKLILIVRDSIKDIISERYPDLIVNPDIIPPSIIIHLNTKICDIEGLIGEAGEIKEEMSLADFRNKDWPSIKETYLWDYFGNSNFMEIDKQKFSMKIEGELHPSCIMINKSNIHISSSAKVSAGTILDATDGPIINDDYTFIDIGVLIKGDTYIGKDSIVNPGAKLRGDVSIGPCCKIGGEIECSTFHGYSNKQHDGYIGHSYIGEWVNLGANTNNSDLKNNYSNIRLKIEDREIDTGKMFVGCMIGDYTKTGISTMINTGTLIGLGANVFGGGFQDKSIPSFSWGGEERTDLEKFLSTLKIVKDRRGKKLSNNEIDFITNFYNLNKSNKL